MLMIAVAFIAAFHSWESQAPLQPVYDEPVIVYAEPTVSPVPVTTPRPLQTPAAQAKLKKPKVELRCTPKVGFSTHSNPLPVMAMLRVENPGDTLWCPGVEWSINGIRVSGHESECNPYETTEAGERELWLEPPKSFGFYAGEYIIEAKLIKAERVIRAVSCSVQVY